MNETSTARPRLWLAMDMLGAEFPTVPRAEIAEILVDARRSVDMFGLSREEEFLMVEKISRERLSQRTTGAERAQPRLMPEKHTRKSGSASK